MKFEIKNSVRKNILQFKPYSVMRDNYLKNKAFIFLDNCENNFGSPLGKGLERYPSSSQYELKSSIAKLKKIPLSNIALGNGSDELIDLLIRTFCEPKKDSILICEPTFGMFKVYAQLNNVEVLNAPLNKENYLFNETKIIKTISKNTKLIFLCSPNNPTGTSITTVQVKKILNNYNGVLVIDEAYIDFSDKKSFVELTKKYANLLVLQTFSKAWGLASIRIGCLIGNSEIVSIINAIRPPFNISGYSQQTLLKAVAKQKVYIEKVNKVKIEKQKLHDKLIKFQFVKTIIESDANFFLIEVTNANMLCDYLLKNKILICNRSKLLNCDNHVRISIGNIDENKKLINVLNKFK